MEGLVNVPETSSEEEEEVDLVRVVPPRNRVVPSGGSETVVAPFHVSTQLSPDTIGGPVDAIVSEAGVSPLNTLAPVSVEGSEQGVISLRRTGRVTAGCHANPYHLPRTVGGSLPASSVSNSVTAIFRPWN